MDKKKVLKGLCKGLCKEAGLVLGISEALILVGCQSNDGSDLAESAAAEGSATVEEYSPRAGRLDLPVRIGREFFESQVVGDLVIRSSDGSTLADVRGDVAFSEGAPYDAAPGEGALADFRDRPGYASFETEGVALKFRVVPDVSSLDVAKDKVTTEGVGALIEERLQAVGNCGSSVERIEFADAKKSKDSDTLVVKFLAYPSSDEAEACAPVQVEFKLSRA